MLGRIIDFSLRNRLLVCLLAGAWILVGVRALLRLPIDAFPDTTPVQVQINTVAPALNPTEVEAQITLPIELTINGLPGLVHVRSQSKTGLSHVVATFADGTPIVEARQLVSERVQSVLLPDGVDRPQLGPISSGLGEVFHYVVRSDDPNRSLIEIRELHDWVIKPELRKAAGVAEVNAWGGFEKQYHVVVQPEKLVKHGLTFRDLVETLEANNRNVGGGVITRGGEALTVRGVGLAPGVEEIGDLVVAAEEGAPVRVRDVADVRIGHEIRRGAVSADGKGEVVLGLGFMLMGENSRDVTRGLRAALAEAEKALPPDVRAEVVYDRTELVDQVIRTVRHNLTAGALLVIAILFAFLGSLRAGLIVAAAIPMSMLFAGHFMLQAGIAASLLSLGAIDFGVIVDSSVIMIENCQRHVSRRKNKPWLDTIRDAALEVRRPTMFGELIILIVFLPILTLEGIEGKMFRPMALTMVFALAGSLIVSLTLMPVGASLFLSRAEGSERGGGPSGRWSLLRRFLGGSARTEPWIVRAAHRAYAPALGYALRFRGRTLAGAAALVAVAALGALRLGGEFLPRLGEGAIAINTVRLAGVSVESAMEYNRRIENRLLEEFPDEIERVWSRLGTAEVATDPMGIELTDIFLALTPRGEWTRARTQAELVQRMDEVLGELPGMSFVFSQPIEMRMNEMIAGIRSDIGIKVYGDDLDVLTRISDEVQHVLVGIRGAADVAGEPITGQPMLEVKVDPEAAGRFGLSAREVLETVEAVAGVRAGEIREGERRFPLVVRLPDGPRTDPDALAGTWIPAASGAVVPLERVAHIHETEGPTTIPREWGRRRTAVQCNVRDRDVGGFVAEAKRRIADGVRLPEGYSLEWGGQFENMQRANRRLLFVVPLTLGLIFTLLYFSLGRARDVGIVATGIPLGAVGGVAALALRGMPFTVSAAIGFIALSGVAMLNGLVLVTFIKQRLRAGDALETAVREACRVRLRPVLMTACVAAVGFLPMAFNTGVGAEVQRPLATVVIGGILSDTLLTLLVLPALYARWGGGTDARGVS